MSRRYGYKPEPEPPTEYICCSRCHSLLITRVPMLLPPIYECRSCGFRGERDDYDTFIDTHNTNATIPINPPLTGTP